MSNTQHTPDRFKVQKRGFNIKMICSSGHKGSDQGFHFSFSDDKVMKYSSNVSDLMRSVIMQNYSSPKLRFFSILSLQMFHWTSTTRLWFISAIEETCSPCRLASCSEHTIPHRRSYQSLVNLPKQHSSINSLNLTNKVECRRRESAPCFKTWL